MTYGARVMLSTPPATNTSPSPAMIACAALLIACRPDPHSRLTVWPRDVDRQAGEQPCHARHVAVVLAGLVGAAEDHVLDQVRLHAGSLHRGLDRQRREVVRADRGERAAVAADRAYGRR